MFANSISQDERVNKVLVAGTAGMKTEFWDKTDMAVSTMLDPAWVAEQIIDLIKDDYSFRFAKILREPPKVEIVETRE